MVVLKDDHSIDTEEIVVVGEQYSTQQEWNLWCIFRNGFEEIICPKCHMLTVYAPGCNAPGCLLPSWPSTRLKWALYQHVLPNALTNELNVRFLSLQYGGFDPGGGRGYVACLQPRPDRWHPPVYNHQVCPSSANLTGHYHNFTLKNK